ncbi:MAG: glycosyltransferase [Clostridia bacterium]|nr:glycosyltransferase [Clostridia bacterium]
MQKIKILIVAGAMEVGGIENQLMHLLRNADKTKYQIDFTTTADHPFYEDEMLSLGAKCIHIKGTAGGKHLISYCREIKKVIKEGGYDIVHSHELFHSGLVLWAAKKAGVKVRIVHAHTCKDGDITAKSGLKRRVYNACMKFLIHKYATDYCACSTLAGEFLFGKKIVGKDNYHLIFNSVDTTMFIENYGREESGEFCDPERVNVIQIGRFDTIKNQLFTVEIAKVLKDRGSNIRILCAGNDGNDYEAKVRLKIKEYGVEDQILLLGVRKDVDVLMRKAKALIQPSLYEGMPLVMIEAQASGLPSVTADTYSHEVDFGVGLMRWMQLSDGAEKWADALEETVKSPRAKKEDVVRVINEKGFDSRIFAERICAIYKNAVEDEIQ